MRGAPGTAPRLWPSKGGDRTGIELSSNLYSAKHRPEIYLDNGVRRGISTFATLADPVEVASGCLRLAADIQSGRIVEVVAAYESRGGDYLIVIATK